MFAGWRNYAKSVQNFEHPLYRKMTGKRYESSTSVQNNNKIKLLWSQNNFLQQRQQQHQQQQHQQQHQLKNIKKFYFKI